MIIALLLIVLIFLTGFIYLFKLIKDIKSIKPDPILNINKVDGNQTKRSIWSRLYGDK